MPIYVYECKKCKTKIDKFLPINHETPICEVCKNKMFKLMSGTTFKLKGPGFYSTTYQKGN